jgi:predicted RNA-binding protein with TRAM domain
MDSQIVDPCVLAEAVSSYSEEDLMRWGIRDGETREVQIEGMKRIFKMNYDILKDTDHVSLFFRDPDGKKASLLWMVHPLEEGDMLDITYTVTGRTGDGPDSCLIRSPSGKRLRVNLYSMAT